MHNIHLNIPFFIIDNEDGTTTVIDVAKFVLPGKWRIRGFVLSAYMAKKMEFNTLPDLIRSMHIEIYELVTEKSKWKIL